MASNYFNKASLVMIPDAPLEGKVLSVKPEDRSGDFTFSRSTAATRVNADGNIEKETQNLLLQSNSFDTTWTTSNASITGGQAGYDGSNDAWIFTTSVLGTAVQQSFSSTGLLTLSVYVKVGSANGIRLRIDTNSDANAYYDLVNGTTFLSGGIDSSITSVGGGWYRCSLTHIVAGPVQVQFFTTDGSTNYSNGSIYIQDAQLEQGLVARDYIETTTTAVEGGITDNLPRLDYTDASCPSLLLEQQRTNLVVQSEHPSSNTTNGYPYVRGNATATYNYGISPEGVQNSTLISGTNGNNGVQVNLTSSAVNQDWSYSFYIKGTLGETINLRFETSPYASQSQEYITFTGDWQRIEKTISYDSTAHTGKHLYITFLSLSTATQFEIYGLQAEANASYATSYIPTYGSAVTRNADALANIDLRTNSYLSGTDFTYMVDLTSNTGVAAFSGFFNETDSSGSYKAGFVWNNGLQWRTPVSGSNQYITIDSSVADGDRAKMLVRCTGSLREVFYNGSKLSTSKVSDNAGSDTDGFTCYYGSSNANFFSPSYNKVLIFPIALTDQEAIDLTTI